MFTISKTFQFSASHQLSGLAAEHPCSRLHGHNYSVTLTLRSDALNAVGFVRDYGELGVVKTYLDEALDHRHLNDVFDFNPTAELIARKLFDDYQDVIPELVSVTVKETDAPTATYGREALA